MRRLGDGLVVGLASGMQGRAQLGKAADVKSQGSDGTRQ